MCWFLLDIAFYGLGLNQSIVLTELGFVSKSGSAYEKLFMMAVGNVIISLMGTGTENPLSLAFIIDILFA